jgi:hypothetical protein
MNASWIEPPPPQRGMGCFGRGCLILIVFILFLAAAFAAGTFLAVRYLRTSYFVTRPAELPASNATDQERETARVKWYDFERAARAHTASRIELTADELNALIASEPDLRGKAFVSIEANTARVQLSIPLSFTRLMRGRYMNAECTVQSDPDGDPANAHITSVIVNGKPVAEDVLDYRGPYGFRHYLAQWSDQAALKTFEIRDGKVILESRSSD